MVTVQGWPAATFSTSYSSTDRATCRFVRSQICTSCTFCHSQSPVEKRSSFTTPSSPASSTVPLSSCISLSPFLTSCPALT